MRAVRNPECEVLWKPQRIHCRVKREICALESMEGGDGDTASDDDDDDDDDDGNAEDEGLLCCRLRLDARGLAVAGIGFGGGTIGVVGEFCRSQTSPPQQSHKAKRAEQAWQ